MNELQFKPADICLFDFSSIPVKIKDTLELTTDINIIWAQRFLMALLESLKSYEKNRITPELVKLVGSQIFKNIIEYYSIYLSETSFGYLHKPPFSSVSLDYDGNDIITVSFVLISNRTSTLVFSVSINQNTLID
jgi:hypothetical protein